MAEIQGSPQTTVEKQDLDQASFTNKTTATEEVRKVHADRWGGRSLGKVFAAQA